MLRVCPFCGAKAMKSNSSMYSGLDKVEKKGDPIVLCSDYLKCPSGPCVSGITEEEAEQKWNTRFE